MSQDLFRHNKNTRNVSKKGYCEQRDGSESVGQSAPLLNVLQTDERLPTYWLVKRNSQRQANNQATCTVSKLQFK